MKRLYVSFAVVLFLGLGCESDGDKSQWDAFWKDVRGENMQMRGSLSGANEFKDYSLQPKSGE